MSNDNELIVNVPLAHADGEPGEPLSDRLVCIIRSLADVGYWPLDFGEPTTNDDGDEFLELFFLYEEDKKKAATAAEHFIRTGGFTGMVGGVA